MHLNQYINTDLTTRIKSVSEKNKYYNKLNKKFEIIEIEGSTNKLDIEHIC